MPMRLRISGTINLNVSKKVIDTMHVSLVVMTLMTIFAKKHYYFVIWNTQIIFAKMPSRSDMLW